MKPYCVYCGKGSEECICEEGGISPKEWLDFFKTKERKMREIVMNPLPLCDVCGDTALYDEKTTKGPWAYLCEYCHLELGTGIGTKLKEST